MESKRFVMVFSLQIKGVFEQQGLICRRAFSMIACAWKREEIHN